MKKSMLFACAALTLLASCKPSAKKAESSNPTATFISLKDSEVKKKKDVKLSELLEDFRIVRFENTDEALCKINQPAFSDHYICVSQGSRNVIKLYDKDGKFIANVGSVGQGPGEYNFIYDIALDEKNGYVYVAPFTSSKKIMRYDLQGKFVDERTLRGDIHKGRLFVQPDGSVSLFHLCFADLGNDFTTATLPLQATDSIQYGFDPHLTTTMMAPDGTARGFNDEVWSNRNTPGFPLQPTYKDTLYHLDPATQHLTPQFAFNMNAADRKESWFIINELPRHYLIIMGGKKSGNILVDKASGEAHEIRLVNDFLGDMEAGPWFKDGYFYAAYEPLQLQEQLEKVLNSGNCPQEQVEKLTQLKNSLHENDNNILLTGKLKQ